MPSRNQDIRVAAFLGLHNHEDYRLKGGAKAIAPPIPLVRAYGRSKPSNPPMKNESHPNEPILLTSPNELVPHI